MFATILMLLTGLALSGVAAWFSVAGLIAIFSAAPLSIMIMGGTLEVAKLVCASWVYNNWSAAPRALKAYMSVAVVVLMFITSMGIFGYLSKAHLEQRAATSDTSLQLERVEQNIAIKEKQLERLTGTEDRLNRAIDTLIEKDKVSQALAQRQRMQRELRAVAVEKKSLQKEIDKLYDEKIPLDISNRQIEAEIGPLKYIAELIYGEQAKSHFDQAVRAVIIILIVVFDPLAVIMLIAANFGMALHRKNTAKEVPASAIPVEVTETPTELPIETVPQKEVLETVPETVQEVIDPPAELLPEPMPELEIIEEPPVVIPESTLTLIGEILTNKEASGNLVWDADTKSWQKDTPEYRWRQNITRQLNRLTPDTNELISLETVRRLMYKLTNNEMTVEELSWAECEAILKYLDNDKPANIA